MAKPKKSAAPAATAIYEAPRLIALDRAMTSRPPLDHRRGPRLESLAGKDPVELLERYGSPLVVFDADRLAATFAHFRDAFTKRWKKQVCLCARRLPNAACHAFSAGWRLEPEAGANIFASL